MDKIHTNFENVKEFLSFLIDNEKVHLYDSYGRAWFYQDFNFYFKDLGGDSFEPTLNCLHLFKNEMHYYA